MTNYVIEDKEKTILSENSEQLNIKYQSGVRGYEKLAKLLFYESINTKEVIDIFKNAQNPKLQTQTRDKLYKLLYPTYHRLEEFNLRQLHFHLPNCDSFLRFHRPDKFGDSLIGSRRSVEIANFEKQMAIGFEEGKIFNGFRFVFPIFDENQTHLGSVETSLSILAFKNDIEKYSDSIINFMILKDVVDAKVFESEKSNYLLSDLHSDYMYEKEVMQHISKESKIIDSQKLQKINQLIKEKIKENIETKSKFSISQKIDSDTFIISFFPIENIDKEKKVAYLISYSKSTVIDSINREYIQIGVTFSILNILIFIFLHKIVKRNFELEQERAKLKEQQKEIEIKNFELSTLFNIQDSLIIITDGDNITNCNQKVYDFFNIDSDSNTKPLNIISNALIEKNGYISDLAEIRWFEQVIQNTNHNLESKVVINSSNRESIFLVKYSNYHILDAHHLFIFIDITTSEEYKSLLEKSNQAQKELLIHQSKLAQIGEMMGVIAHQLKQPLNTISLLVGFLLNEYEFNPNEFSDSLNEHENRVMEQLKFMALTIDIFRDFFNPTKEQEEFLAIDSINSVVTLMEIQLKKHSIKLSIEQKNDSLMIFGSKNEFIQIILNIINNAKDALKDNNINEKKIEIYLDSNDKYAIIEISDNAGGIDESLLPDKIFNSYTTTKEYGTGIGLFITKLVVEDNFKGKIEARNGEKGAIFKIMIPLVDRLKA